MSKEKVCPICNNHSTFRLKKMNVDYFQCSSCRLLYSEAIDQDNMVGGEHEEVRNYTQNSIRIERINEMIIGSRKEDVKILDFGCGHGLFVEALKKAGFEKVTGFDLYNEEFNRLPEPDTFHLVVMTEVIEHIPDPYIELDLICKSMVDRGVIMIETSFVDIAQQDGIKLEDFFYIAPQNGHSTIHSHHSLDLLMVGKGFVPIQHVDRNVRLFRKIKR